MSKKVLFFDIDGTLFSEVTKTVPESTRAALRKARALGHLVFINTGRSYGQLGPILDMVECDGVLCGCGTYVEAEGNVLYHYEIPTDQARVIKDTVLSCKMEAVLESKAGCYYSHETAQSPASEELLQYIDFAIKGRGWENCGDVKFEKLCVMGNKNSDTVAFYRGMGLGMDVVDRGNNFYECVPAGHSKATAIEVILNYYHMDLKDAYVFGDSLNDLSMFEYAPNAILMGKHDKELEPFASFRTKTVEQDGVAFAMERLGLV